MTSEELDIMEDMWRKRMPIRKIAEAIGYSKSHVTYVAMRNRDRFPRRHNKIKGTESEQRLKRELAIARIESGRSTPEIEAERLGLNVWTVKNWIWRKRKK